LEPRREWPAPWHPRSRARRRRPLVLVRVPGTPHGRAPLLSDHAPRKNTLDITEPACGRRSPTSAATPLANGAAWTASPARRAHMPQALPLDRRTGQLAALPAAQAARRSAVRLHSRDIQHLERRRDAASATEQP